MSDPQDTPTKTRLGPAEQRVEKFQLRELKAGPLPSYRKIRESFEKEKLSARDQRFFLSEHIQNQLSVEEEEERRFRERVADTVAKLREETEKAAYAKGHAEGEKTGREKAYTEEKARLAALIEGLAAVTDDLAKAKLQLSDQYEKSVVDLAYRVAAVIVDHEIEEKPAQVAETIKAILDRIARDDDVRIRLPTREFGALQEIQEELKSFTRSGRIQFEMDSSLKSGECIVESMSGEIASIMEDKLARLREEINRVYPNAIKKVSGT